MVLAIIHGFVLAFPLIMPLGAQNVFLFNQGATQPRFVNVLPVVITAAICDTILISLAALGISVVVLGSLILKSVLIVLGSIFLLYMGWTNWVATPGVANGNAGSELSLRQKIVFTMSVSLLNPHAIMDTVGVIGISALKYSGLNKIAFTTTTILVSWIWFFGLALAGRITGKIDKTGNIGLVLNKVSAIIMWIAAIYLMLSFDNPKA